MTNPVRQNGVSRRNAIKTLAAGTAGIVASGVAPTILLADEKTPVLGSGAHKFEWVREFAKPPEGVKFGDTHAVQVDSQGRVLVHTNRSKDSVYIYDAEGKFIKSWGPEYSKGAHGMLVSKEGNAEFLYFATTGQHTCAKTTLDGEVVWKLEFPKECEAYQGKPDGYVPTNIAVAANGDFYVADGYGKNWIHQYSKDAKYIRSFGGPGKEPGKLRCAHGILMDTRGKEPLVLVTDREAARMQYFTLDGKHHSIVADELRRPADFGVHKGDLLIPDLAGRVTLFDKDNKLICHLGDNPTPANRAKNNLPREQWKDGEFMSPHGACWDKDGNIFVAEWVSTGRVTKLRRVNA